MLPFVPVLFLCFFFFFNFKLWIIFHCRLLSSLLLSFNDHILPVGVCAQKQYWMIAFFWMPLLGFNTLISFHVSSRFTSLYSSFYLGSFFFKFSLAFVLDVQYIWYIYSSIVVARCNLQFTQKTEIEIWYFDPCAANELNKRCNTEWDSFTIFILFFSYSFSSLKKHIQFDEHWFLICGCRSCNQVFR